jgi:cysteinyl-tRNA synthetase
MGAGKPAAIRSHRPAGGQRASRFSPALVFGLKLVASALAGATITMVLWPDDWTPAAPPQPDRSATAAYPARQGTIVYRSAPRDGSARGSKAESMASSSGPASPSHGPRRVETVTIAAAVPEVTGAQEVTAAPPAAVPRNVALPLASARPSLVKSWRYQLQNINPAEIANSSADLVVVDFSSNDGPFSKAQVERMQQKPDGSRRLVLSYMSIGEAETYRWYWSQRSSSWLGRENPKWRGNYGVRFWNRAWQEIIFSYTDRILAAGFDGVYLDKVDEFETMGHREDMVEFVARIAARAKSQRSDFLVVSQNGDQLLSDNKFRSAIDGFAREDLFYGEDSDGKRNAPSSIRESVARLKMLAAEGKPVLVVEYPRNDDQARIARREISEQGFIGLMARRSLSAL